MKICVDIGEAGVTFEFQVASQNSQCEAKPLTPWIPLSKPESPVRLVHAANLQPSKIERLALCVLHFLV